MNDETPKVGERKTGRELMEPPTRLEKLKDAVRHATKGGQINSEDLQDLQAFLDEQSEPKSAKTPKSE